MRSPSRIPATVKFISILVIMLISLFLCSCEKDSVSTDPERLGGVHFDGIYISPTGGDQSIAGTPNSSKVVLTHMYKSCIYYNVGTVDADSGTVNWGGNSEWSDSLHVCDCPLDPMVSISDNGVVVCAFQAGNYQETPVGKIWVGVGTINGNSINWDGFSYEGISGYYPSIAITRDGKYAIMVFQGDKNGGAIYYTTTPVDPNSNSLNWSTYNQLGMGYRPSIAMNNKDQFVCIFNAWQNNCGLWCQAGQFYRDNNTVDGLGCYSFGATDRDSYARPFVTMGDGVYGDTNVFALAPGEYANDGENFYGGNLSQNCNLTWDGSATIAVWITSASITVGRAENIIEAYQDGNNFTKMYYFFIE